MISPGRLLAIIVVLVLAAVPASGLELTEEEPFEPDLQMQRGYFKCDGALSSRNLAGALSGAPEWRFDPPTGSLFGGDGGCSLLDVGDQGDAAPEPSTDAVFTGTFTGNLEALSLEYHALDLGSSDSWNISIGVTIDGMEVVPWPTDLTVRRRAANGGISNIIDVSVLGVDLLTEDDQGEHELTVAMSARGRDRLVLWSWDINETQAGLVLNPVFPAPVRVDAVPREERVEALPPGEGLGIPVPDLPDPGELPDPGVPTPEGVSGVSAAGPLAQSLGYLTPQVTVRAGMGLSFGNFDMAQHDIVSLERNEDRSRIFGSKLANFGEIVPVEGVEDLPPGSYAFTCSIHGAMRGTLTVSG
jgi:plastocyanin